MALVKKCRSSLQFNHCGLDADEGLELGHYVRCTRSFGRKRILFSNNNKDSLFDSNPKTPLKKQRGNTNDEDCEKSSLEVLPLDILVSLKIPISKRYNIYT